MTDQPLELENTEPPLPKFGEFVVQVQTGAFRLRASDARALLKATGQTLTTLLQSDDIADQVQSYAFIELRRRQRAATPADAPAPNYLDPAVTWEMALEIDVELGGPAQILSPDPLSETSS